MRYETVHESFRGFVARTAGDEGRAWIARLPAVHAELAARWRLRLGRELPGGRLSSVRTVLREDGTGAVLKVGSGFRARDEIGALRVWAGCGAPRLLAQDERLGAMLLELIDPGEHPTAAPAETVAALLDVLHVSTDDRLPTLEAVVRVRVDTAFEDGRASARKAAWAHARIDQLVRTAARQTLLHGDLDERNLLVCGQRGLCAIDPLPCVGDPAYDAGYWVHGNRRSGRRARLDAIVAATGFDRDRVRDWAAVVGVHG